MWKSRKNRIISSGLLFKTELFFTWIVNILLKIESIKSGLIGIYLEIWFTNQNIESVFTQILRNPWVSDYFDIKFVFKCLATWNIGGFVWGFIIHKNTKTSKKKATRTKREFFEKFWEKTIVKMFEKIGKRNRTFWQLTISFLFFLNFYL